MISFTVTLAAANTNYDLLTLVRVIDANYVDTASQVHVQAASGNTSLVLVGDANLTGTTYIGAELDALDSLPLGPAAMVALRLVTARSAGTAQKLNIAIQR